jgi:hypothetical protein
LICRLATTSVGIRFRIASAIPIRVITADMIGIMAVAAAVITVAAVADAMAVTAMVAAEVVIVRPSAMAITRTGAELRVCREEISAMAQWDGPLPKSRLPGAWSNQNL